MLILHAVGAALTLLFVALIAARAWPLATGDLGVTWCRQLACVIPQWHREA
jgi:hypothetical protein